MLNIRNLKAGEALSVRAYTSLITEEVIRKLNRPGGSGQRQVSESPPPVYSSALLNYTEVKAGFYPPGNVREPTAFEK